MSNWFRDAGQRSGIAPSFQRPLASVNTWVTVAAILCSVFLTPVHGAGQYVQQGTKWVGSGGSAAGVQGTSVAISADGRTALIGGPGDQNDVGAAWVFANGGNAWTQQGTRLVGSEAVGKSRQGASLALSGDGNTAIVGGPGDSGGADFVGGGSGAAWVFAREGGVWTQQGAKLVGSDVSIAPYTGMTRAAPRQGIAVAISADGNTAIVGGDGDNNFLGAVWIYTRSNGAWTQQGPKLVASDAFWHCQHGASVALSADGNTAVVGGIDSVWVYVRSGGVWSQQGPRLVATDDAGTSATRSVAISADGATILVGSSNEGPDKAGAARVFTRDGGVWTQQGPKLVASDARMGPSQSALQGASVALSANGDLALVGGPGDSGGLGAAWLWRRSGGAWSQQGLKLVGSDATGSASLGQSVTMAADGSAAIVGGAGDSGGVGAAWLFAPARPATAFRITAPSEAAVGASFEFVVTALDADGNLAADYAGTVHFTSSDGAAKLPANATLANGVGTFRATLRTAGTQFITATDTVTIAITGSSQDIGVAAWPLALTRTPASLAFGGQSMRTTSPAQAVTITNTGTWALGIASVTTAAPFAVAHDCGPSLAVGASCTAAVTFTPAAEGTAVGTLVVTADIAVPDTPLSGVGEKSLVTHFYHAIMRRDPDAGGKAYWEGIATTLPTWGASINETWYAMAMYFYSSAEYQGFKRDNAGFVTDLYRTFFNRDPDFPGLAYWVGVLERGTPREVVLAEFMFSTEFAAFTQAIFGNTPVRPEVNLVMDFYRGLLGRLPDKAGFDNWLTQIQAAQCSGTGSASAVTKIVDTISRQFLASGEYLARARSNGQYVGDLYNAFLRRGGDEAGVAHWVNQLDSGGSTRDQERLAFLASPEFTARVNAVVAQGCALFVPRDCTLTATPPHVPHAGTLVTLTAACTGGQPATGYAWTGGDVKTTTKATEPTQSVWVRDTTTFTMTAFNSYGPATVATVTVPVDPFGPALSCSGFTSTKVADVSFPDHGETTIWWHTYDDIFSYSPPSWRSNDAVILRFVAPPAGDRYLRIRLASEGVLITRTFALSTQPCEFAKTANTLFAEEANDVSVPMQSGPTGAQAIQLIPGQTYYLNIANRAGGKNTCANVCEASFSLQNPPE